MTFELNLNKKENSLNMRKIISQRRKFSQCEENLSENWEFYQSPPSRNQIILSIPQKTSQNFKFSIKNPERLQQKSLQIHQKKLPHSSRLPYQRKSYKTNFSHQSKEKNTKCINWYVKQKKANHNLNL